MNTNPKLYEVASQQLTVLRTLAKMSLRIDDRQGATIIQAAEIAIERRIQDTSMSLTALEYLNKLIDQGHKYSDAEWRTTQCYSDSPDQLRTDYDNQQMI